MKPLHLLAILTFLPGLALAQTSTTPADAPAPQRQGHHRLDPGQDLARLTKALHLSDIQQGQIKPLPVSRDEQLKTIHENTSLTEDQKHAQMKALFESTNQQIESFLNPAQVAQFKALHQHHAKPSPQQ